MSIQKKRDNPLALVDANSFHPAQTHISQARFASHYIFTPTILPQPVEAVVLLMITPPFRLLPFPFTLGTQSPTPSPVRGFLMLPHSHLPTSRLCLAKGRHRSGFPSVVAMGCSWNSSPCLCHRACGILHRVRVHVIMGRKLQCRRLEVGSGATFVIAIVSIII